MSKIEVNTVDVQCGSTLTLGSSGKTVTLASGASQSGFGRTGTVDWCTTAKTSPFTAVSGDGFFLNTTGGAITVTLPGSPSAGDIVAFKDYANTWDTNNVTLARNGSKINGECSCATLRTESQSVTLIYVDGTKGWQDIHDSTANVTGVAYVAATGGTETTSGDFKIHTFTSSGCFQVTNAGNSTGSNKVSYMVIAGGGGSGRYYGGGGGAGGYREGKDSPKDSYTASPLAAADSGLPVSVQTYPITVGGGGATGCGSAPYTAGVNGANSVFSSITSAGGGGGAGGLSVHDPAKAGGSGGGGHYPSPAYSGSETGGAGNTPPVAPPQGNPGTTTPAPAWAGGGGGATSTGPVRVGGAGATSSINASSVGRAGGGSGGPCSGTGSPQPGAAGSSDGGGAYNTNGTANTGGGGGSDGGSGGSGIVVIRYKFQN